MGQEVSKPPEGASGVPEAALNVSVPTAGEPAASNLSRSHSAHMLSHAVPPAVSDERHRRAHTWQHRGQQRRVYTRAPWPARGGSSTPGPSDTESEASVSESGGLSRTGSSNRVKRSISEASDCSELGEDRPRGPGHGDGHHGNSGTWPRMPKRSSSSSQLRHDRLDVWELTHALAREKSDLTSLLARMTSEAEARGDGGPAPPALNRLSSDDSTACDSQLWQLDALVAKERQRAEVDDGTLNSILGALQDQFKPEEPPSAAPVVLPKRAPAPRHTPPPPHPPPAAALYGLPHAPHPHVPRPHAPPPLMPHAPHASSAHHHAHQQVPQDVPHYASYHAPRPPYEYEGNAYWYTGVLGAPAIGQHASLPVHGRAGGDPTSCVTLPPATGAVLGARKGAVLGACHGAALGACHGAVLGVCNGAVLGAYSHESAGSAAAGTSSRPQRMPPAVPLLPEAALGPQAFARSSSDHLGPSRTSSNQLGPARTISDHLGPSPSLAGPLGAHARTGSPSRTISDHLGRARTGSPTSTTRPWATRSWAQSRARLFTSRSNSACTKGSSTTSTFAATSRQRAPASPPPNSRRSRSKRHSSASRLSSRHRQGVRARGASCSRPCMHMLTTAPSPPHRGASCSRPMRCDSSRERRNCRRCRPPTPPPPRRTSATGSSTHTVALRGRRTTRRAWEAVALCIHLARRGWLPTIVEALAYR